jgi:hypothetical protein
MVGVRDFRWPLGALVVVTFVGLLSACPPADKDKKPSATSSSSTPTVPTPACTKVGQSCEIFGNKLGTCVQKDDCLGDPPCFVCQSQH